MKEVALFLRLLFLTRGNNIKRYICYLLLLAVSMSSSAQESDLFRKDGHKSILKTISISPDNKYFISVENDTLAILWDMATGQQLKTIKNVEAASFKNNNAIYLAMNDKTFKEIDLDGQTIKTYASKGAKYNITRSSVYDDIPKMFYPEKGLYFFGDDVFDMDKGYIKRLVTPTSGYGSRDYSPVINQMAIADKKTGKITFFSIETGEVVNTVQTDHFEEENIKISFSPNGEKLLVTKPSAFLLIDVAAGKIQRTIKSTKGDGEFGAFSPDGETVVLAEKDYDKSTGHITMLDVKSGTTLYVKNFNNLALFVKMKFSPDGKNLVLWLNIYYFNKEKNIYDGDRENVYLLDAKTGYSKWLYKHEGWPTSTFGSNLQLTSDGQKILFGSSVNLQIVNTNTGMPGKSFSEISQGSIRGMYFINNNSQMTVATNDYISTWNLQNGEVENVLCVKAKAGIDSKMAYAPLQNGKAFFVIRDDNLIEVDSTGKFVFQYANLKKIVSKLNATVTKDGQYVMIQGLTNAGACATNNDAYTVEVFNTKTHKLVYTNNCVNGDAAFANTQNILLIQEKSGTRPIKLYEIPSGKLLYEIKTPINAINYNELVFSPSDNYLAATVSEQKTGFSKKVLIDLKTKNVKNIPEKFTIPIYNREKEKLSLTAICFTPDEKYIVYDGWRSKSILFYDIEKESFDEQMTINYPTGVTLFSAINVSPNGKFIFFGTYRGSIMLWDIEEKKFKGTLYPDAAKRNWAVINAQGNFDANAGAQNDMFHVSGNTVVPLNSMFEKFYTPRLFPRILSGENFGLVEIDIKKLKKAPTVKMQFKENARNLEVTDDDVQTIETKISSASVAITAECPLDAVTEIRLYQNGKLIETTRNLTVEDEMQGDKTMTKTFVVNLVEGTNRFRTIAFNTERTESRPLEINVVFKREKTSEVVISMPVVELHIVIVGINIYKNTKYNLNYALDDAEAFKLALESGAKSIFGKVNTHFIKDAEATKEGIVVALEKVKDEAGAEDVFVFYFAGHGVVNDRKEFFLVPSDVIQLYGSDDALAQKGLSAASLQQFSKDIKAQKQLYILDACQSAGALDDIVAARGAAEEKAIAQLARSTGTHWLTASGSSQFASEFSQLGHGAFTYCLLEGLKGGADNGDKKISIKELDTYLQLKVPEVTEKYKGTAQYPASYGYGNDFPIIIIK